MKKLIIVSIMLLMAAAATTKASNPIPSYNVPIYGPTLFEETGISPFSSFLTDKKRDMNIQNSGGSYSPGGSFVVAYLYRLDFNKTQGPFIIQSGQTLSVPIDKKPWGVLLNPSPSTTVSVWISN